MPKDPKAPSSSWDPMSADFLSGKFPARILCKESHSYYSGYLVTPKIRNTNFLTLSKTAWGPQSQFTTKKCRSTQAQSPPELPAASWSHTGASHTALQIERQFPTLVAHKSPEDHLKEVWCPGHLPDQLRQAFSLQWVPTTVSENLRNSSFPQNQGPLSGPTRSPEIHPLPRWRSYSTSPFSFLSKPMQIESPFYDLVSLGKSDFVSTVFCCNLILPWITCVSASGASQSPQTLGLPVL